MARKTWVVLLAALVGGGLAMRAVAGDQEKKEGGHEGHEHAHGEEHDHDHGHGGTDAMWEAMAKTGPEHELLKDMAGTWKTEMTSYMEPSGKPAVNEGVSEIKLIMDGRFAVENFTSEYQDKPFKGMGVFGYDNAKKKYVGTWLDNMGTGIMHSEGTYDESTKTLTMHGSSATPMGEMKMKMENKCVSKDKSIFTMYMVMPGESGETQEMKAMQIVYTRM